MILIEHDMLEAATVATAARRVWAERDRVDPPRVVPPLPESWRDRYEHTAADHTMDTRTFPAAVASVVELWAEMFPTEET